MSRCPFPAQAFCIVLPSVGSTWYLHLPNWPDSLHSLFVVERKRSWCVCVCVCAMPTWGRWRGSWGHFGPPPPPARRKLGTPGRRWWGCRSSRGPLVRHGGQGDTRRQVSLTSKRVGSQSSRNSKYISEKRFIGKVFSPNRNRFFKICVSVPLWLAYVFLFFIDLISLSYIWQHSA